MTNLKLGTVLENRYKIVRRLRQGGMGAVFLAQDRRLNRRCAVKMALRTGPDTEAQFRREAALLADLHHPNLPRVTDYFAEGDRYFLVMDYVRGQDFHEIVQSQGALPESKVLRWLPQILDALEYLHNQQPQPIIHRDVKPANIKLTPEGRVMLVDFGIAKLFDPRMRTVTAAQAISPGFSSPEQYGRGFTDARSDIYSLGATLYYLLTGVAPAESLDRVAGVAELIPPRQRNPRISSATEDVVLRAMALNRNQRFGSVGEMREALPAAPTTTPAGPLEPTPDLRVLVPIIGLIALVLVIGLGAFGAWRMVDARLASTPLATVGIADPATQVVTVTANATSTQPTSTLTPRPTVTEFAVPIPEMTRIATATLRPTAVGVRYPAPELRSPSQGASIVGPAVFTWSWDEELQENESFDLRVWRQDPPDQSVGRTRDESYIIERPPDGAGKYWWRVVVVREMPDGQIIEVSAAPAPILLDFWRGEDGGDRSETETPEPTIPTSDATTPVPPGEPTPISEGSVSFYPAPSLISPSQGESIIGPSVFWWSWDGNLGRNEFFDVHVWRLDTAEASVGRTRETTYRIEQPPNGTGKYWWRVVVIRELPKGQIIEVSSAPAPIMLDFWRNWDAADTPEAPTPTHEL